MKSFLSLGPCCRERLHENFHLFDDCHMNKTPYPTNLEIVLFLADVFDVREKGKGLYKASKKPLRHFYYEIQGLLVNHVEGPLKNRMSAGIDGIDDWEAPGLSSLFFYTYRVFWDYCRLPLEVNVGDIERNELMPVLIEEVFVPWAVGFMFPHGLPSMHRVLEYIVSKGFCEDVNPVKVAREFLDALYNTREYCSGKPFPADFPKSMLACVYPESKEVGKAGRDDFNRMRSPSNTKIINIAKDLENIKCQESGERVFSEHEVNHAKWCIFFGALFNRCLDKAERYVSRARLLAVMREVHDRASSNDSHVDMEFYKKRFKERISSMLNSCGGSSASEPRYVLHMREARRLLSEGLPAASVDECVKAARTAAYSGGRLEYAVVNEAFCMLSFMYRFGTELWDGGCGDGRKMRGELKYMKEILLGLGRLYAWHPRVEYVPDAGWCEVDRERGEGDCDEFRGRAVVCGKEIYDGWTEIFGRGVSDGRTMAFRDGISDYEITESAMSFVEHRLGGFNGGPSIGVIGGVDSWNYRSVISGYKFWHGRRVYNEVVLSPVKEGGDDFGFELILD